MNAQIYDDNNNLIHPETDSGVVLHNNSNLKSFLNGLVSTDNMPAFMQNFLMCNDYVEANQILKTNPEKYFDHAFNTWTATNAPALSNGVCNFNGSNQYLKSTPGWTIGGSDFSVEVRFKPADVSTARAIFSTSNATTSGNAFFDILLTAAGTLQWRFRNSSNTTYNIVGTTALSANSWYTVEINFDSSDNSRRLFLNGKLEGSRSNALLAFKIFTIGGDRNA